MHDFNRHKPVEVFLIAFVHLGHAPAAQLFFYDIFADFFAA